ncbi:MAG: lytic transglycosylase [Alphaproteobacteria bacterium CG11_big_fil_rev_8_21_14_0_20_39_49]|nr:MAG: lytic transglycosylase [Alphaproteobacteria bacterium CG11_big_fil_rev_8_21_14_0_20_39_49]
MIFSIFKRVVFVVILLLSNLAFANEKEEIVYDEKLFHGWIVDFVEEAKQKGISEQTIYKFMKDVKFVPRAIELDRTQPYKTKTFEEYLQTVVPDFRVQRAKAMLKENEKILNEVSKKYGVQPRFIVALWAVESDFGRNMGGFTIVNTLATLAFEGRRAEFFKKELLDALKIIDEGHIAFEDMKGSWAGAMGQTQFMPSSFLELAVDHNNDGKRDIWGTKEDVFASIANYLSKRGWNDDITWGREVKLPKNFDEKLIGRDVEKGLSDWKKLGVRKADGGSLPQRADIKASIIKPEDDKKRAFLVYSNYKTVLKWNRSLYFATAVGMLSDGIIN